MGDIINMFFGGMGGGGGFRRSNGGGRGGGGGGFPGGVHFKFGWYSVCIMWNCFFKFLSLFI